MSKKIFTDAFFTQFTEFLTQLETAFPEDPDFPAYKSGLKLLKMTNPALVTTEFAKNVIPFEKTIKDRDESFFMDYKFAEVLETDMSMEAIISKLKQMWSSLSDGSKKAIWDHINLLVDLSKRC
jgi:hypothetical protein